MAPAHDQQDMTSDLHSHVQGASDCVLCQYVCVQHHDVSYALPTLPRPYLSPIPLTVTVDEAFYSLLPDSKDQVCLSINRLATISNSTSSRQNEIL